MSLRYQRLRHFSKLLPRILPGYRLHQSINAMVISVLNSDYNVENISNSWILNSQFHSKRYSTSSLVSREDSFSPAVVVDDDLLSFIKSTFNKIQGPNHCWLNKVDEQGDKDYCKEEGIFLVLAGELVKNSQIVAMIEKIKFIQQRFPQLSVMGFHCGSSISSTDCQTWLVELIMKEFITFPILLSNKNCLQMKTGACYILFKDFKSPAVYHDMHLDIVILIKAIEELYLDQNEKIKSEISSFPHLKRAWVKQAEVIKEPYASSFLQNLSLYFPGCISADESGDRLFLSDSNHHRIIIFDGNGKIIDSIGSSPGFEDGEFETAKLMRPAASFYHDVEDCLYIVDSENKAIRRANMEKRVLETLCPVHDNGGIFDRLFEWFMGKMRFMRIHKQKSKLLFPWHLLKPADDSLLIINRSFQSLWIIDIASGEIEETIRGFPRILETCGPLIMEKVSLLKQMPSYWLQQQVDANYSIEGLPFASLLSSVTTFQNHLVMCDTVAQSVLKLNRQSGISSNFQFSNFGILGFPYWPSFILERVYSEAAPAEGWIDHLQSFNLLPGRIDIRLNIDIPDGVDLAEPLQEGSIWRQARGAATEVLRREGAVRTSEKVSVAQQWYDELDNLAFSTPESEMIDEENHTIVKNDVEPEDTRAHINCSVNTSPGTSEVIIYAALYLKLKRHPDLQEDNREKYAARIVDIVNTARKGGIEKDSCIKLLLRSNVDLRDLIFMKPLHVRIKINTLDHPKAETGKDFILTDDRIEVNVVL